MFALWKTMQYLRARAAYLELNMAWIFLHSCHPEPRLKTLGVLKELEWIQEPTWWTAETGAHGPRVRVHEELLPRRGRALHGGRLQRRNPRRVQVIDHAPPSSLMTSHPPS